MSKWIVRGLVFAAAMVLVRVVQGALINAFQTQSGLISAGLLLIFIIIVVVWGVRDGRADARVNPDPDRRADLAMTWLLAGLLAGIVSGAVAWLIALFYKGLYTGGLLNEVTTFAAFTSLIVFLFGLIGVAFGRWRVDRKGNYVSREGDEDEDRADTDVFSAVRGDDGGRTREAAAQPEARHSAVATAEREAPTDTISTRERQDEGRTETITTQAHQARTQAAPVHESQARTQEASLPESEAPTESFRLPGSHAGGEDKTEVIRTRDVDETKPDTPRRD